VAPHRWRTRTDCGRWSSGAWAGVSNERTLISKSKTPNDPRVLHMPKFDRTRAIVTLLSPWRHKALVAPKYLTGYVVDRNSIPDWRITTVLRLPPLKTRQKVERRSPRAVDHGVDTG
jgi:hypothetical protein